ncbi:MAG: 5-histidylcysteine sulfoxide synthase [Campylobacterota bacterium]|nr:5-histidylcysteine sulfoxide synthase [Campylobacterota bacterium]
MQLNSLLPPTLTGNSPALKRQEILEYFQNTYTLYEKLFEVFVSDEVFYQQSELTRHPMIFYFGHTATFFINKLILAKVITKRINPDFESIFAIGVDEMQWDDLSSENYAWPDINEVRAYRAELKSLIEELILSLPLSLPITQDDPFWVILMGIEHERIHIETSSVLHRQLDISQVKSHPEFLTCKEFGDAPKNELVSISAATISLGKDKTHHLYGWDNEYGKQSELVNGFETSKYLVSNGEFMEFVNDGGYQKAHYWDAEGRKFLEISAATHPTFWVKGKNGFQYRSMTQIMDMPLNWPVDVNNLEAMAFCRWKGEKDASEYRLLSEAEWYVLYERAGLSDVPDFDENKANINLAHYASSCPVDTFCFGDIYDVLGNVWQWTQTPIDGFEGFEPHGIYDDFSVPTFDGKHNLIKGGSWISSGNELMKHSRYAFRRHFYQHAGFRYVKGAAMQFDENIYESDSAISQYCEFQYANTSFGVENFASHCARLASDYSVNHTKALDLGCATGRASFELARHFDKVIGIDFSARFIQVGVALQTKGQIFYERQEEGEIKTRQTHTLEEIDLLHVKDKVDFFQGDACNLKAHFEEYDLIMATNLIDRLYEPRLFLETVHKRLNEEGILILTSPYTWLEEYTAKEFWIGGYEDENGDEISTLEGLKKVLEKNFELIDTQDIEFVIRETPRKFQHSIAQMSVWKKI